MQFPKSANRFLYRLLQITVFVSSFLTIYEPKTHGMVLTSILNVSTMVLCVRGMMDLYRQGFLSKTAPEIYEEISVRPRLKSRTEATLNMVLIIFSIIATSHS